MAETSGQTSSGFASVVTTSGTTGGEGEISGNSWKFAHHADAFSTLWGDAALAARDSRARKSEAVVTAVDKLTYSQKPRLVLNMQLPGMTRINKLTSYGDDDDENYEDDVDLHTADCDDELEEAACTAVLPTDLVLLSLVHPSTDRKLAKFSVKGKTGKRKRKTSSHNCGQFPNLGTPGVLPKPPTSRSGSRPPTSKKRPTETGTTRIGPHHAPRFRPDQCMLCRQVGHRASECLNKGKATSFSPGKCAFGTYALDCAVFDAMCYGATVKETEEDQDENDIEDFVAFSIKSLEGFATLDGGATKTVSGFMSDGLVHPSTDRKLAKFGVKDKKGKRKRKTSSHN